MQWKEKPIMPCHNCGGKIFWSKGFGWVCERDNPCPDKNGATFVEVGKDELATKDNSDKV